MLDLSALSAHSGIPEAVLQAIIQAGKLYAQRVVLYGSRARGDHKPWSDMDIAFYGSRQDYRAFENAMDQLPCLLKVDLAFITSDTEPVFVSQVRKDGIVLMEKAAQRIDQFQTAIDRLSEVAGLYRNDPENIILRDALIQRFEFTYEVAWKALKDALNELGFVDIRSPKMAIQEAFAQGFIHARHESDWVDLMKARNLTTHMYSEAIVNEIAQDVAGRYLEALTATLAILQKNI